jgi:hypothetical protein
MPAYSAQPADHVSPAATLWVVDGIGVGVLGALLVLALVRRGVHRRREKLAHKAALRQGESLHLGPSVLAGVVVDDGEGDAVVVEIDQLGREYKTKSGWSHQWSEARRSVEVKPFYVARANGERVRVEPDAEVFLIDKLDVTVRTGHTQRVRRARLSPGEHVFILGDMVRAPDPKLGGYREAAEGWVLRPPRGERMLVSTEPLEDRHQARAKVWRNLALIGGAFLLLWHGLLFVDVHAKRISGQVVTKTAVDKRWSRNWVRPSKGRPYWAYHYYVDATGSDGTRDESQVDYASYQAIENGTELSYVQVDGKPLQIGAKPCAGSGSTAFGVVMAAIWAIVYLVVILSTRPWWMRKRVVETGTGRL